jgi:hypothetical protein
MINNKKTSQKSGKNYSISLVAESEFKLILCVNLSKDDALGNYELIDTKNI